VVTARVLRVNTLTFVVTSITKTLLPSPEKLTDCTLSSLASLPTPSSFPVQHPAKLGQGLPARLSTWHPLVRFSILTWKFEPNTA